MSRDDDLERLLDEAREASPSDRLPTYRDPIADFGATAVDRLALWLDEPAFAAFAIRTIQRIATLHADAKDDAIAALLATDRSQMSTVIAGDLDAALDALGMSPARRAARDRGARLGPRTPGSRPALSPGVDGRRYWAMRTSPERPYVWAEAQRGRLRQGWGWAEEQNLEIIAAATRAGQPLSEEQQMAWASRRMMSTEPDGMRLGDLILTPNILEWGLVCVFRLIGSYEFALDAPMPSGDRFGHVLPVDLVGGPISRYDARVSDALQASMRNPSRLWNLTPYGGDVERLVGAV